MISRSSRAEVFCKKGVLGNFTKFTGKHLYQSLLFNKVTGLWPATLLEKTLSHVFSCEFCEISKNTFFYRTPLVAVSGIFFIQNIMESSSNGTACQESYISNQDTLTSLKLIQSTSSFDKTWKQCSIDSRLRMIGRDIKYFHACFIYLNLPDS